MFLRKVSLYSVLFLLLSSAIGLTYDLLNTSDEERIEALIDSLSGPLKEEHIDKALKYVNPISHPIEIVVDGNKRKYSKNDSSDFATQTRKALAPYLNQSIEPVQESVEINNDKALVHLRLSTPEGLVNLMLKLNRDGRDWWITKVRLS